MSSAKMLLCDFCVILLFAIYFVIADDKVKSTKVKDDSSTKGKCSCGGFPTSTPELGTPPLLSQSPDLVIKCDDEGEATCKKLCTALATAAKAQGPMLICNRLKNADELKLSAFYKICEKPWTYMENMTEVRPLCCEDSKVKICASVAKEMGNCTCGAFPTQTPEAGAAPLLSQNTDPIKCDDEGVTACRKSCATLASDKKTTAPDHLCTKLKTADQLKLSAFYKPCDKPWFYITNMTTPRPICCDSGKVKVCEPIPHQR